MYPTYIIFSEKLNKYYVGATEDLERRLQEHNTSRSPYTKTGSSWQLIPDPAIAVWLKQVQRTYFINPTGSGRPA